MVADAPEKHPFLRREFSCMLCENSRRKWVFFGARVCSMPFRGAFACGALTLTDGVYGLFAKNRKKGFGVVGGDGLDLRVIAPFLQHFGFIGDPSVDRFLAFCGGLKKRIF